MFKPSSNFLTDRSKTVLLLWIPFVICVLCFYLPYCLICCLQPCGPDLCLLLYFVSTKTNCYAKCVYLIENFMILVSFPLSLPTKTANENNFAFSEDSGVTFFFLHTRPGFPLFNPFERIVSHIT